MKHLFTFFLVLSLSTTLIFAQEEKKDEGWKVGGQVGINLTETTFHNWAKGGENSLSGISYLNLFANRNYGNWVWENNFDFEYGLMQIQDGDLKKTNDRIELNSKVGRQASKSWYYSGYLNFKTQVAEGFDYAKSNSIYISKFMAPAYLTAGIGMDYKPNETFSAMLAPVASKTTFVLDERLADAGSFGLKTAEQENGVLLHSSQIRQELGASVTLTYKKEVFKNINLNTKLSLFSNYLKNPQNIDVDWQTTITMKINDYINAIFRAHLIYDDDINIAWEKDGVPQSSPKIQFNQGLSVGFAYKFNN